MFFLKAFETFFKMCWEMGASWPSLGLLCDVTDFPSKNRCHPMFPTIFQILGTARGHTGNGEAPKKARDLSPGFLDFGNFKFLYRKIFVQLYGI